MLNTKLLIISIGAALTLSSPLASLAEVSDKHTLLTFETDTDINREASEGPRGGDNEQPGDRHRRNRGGRKG